MLFFRDLLGVLLVFFRFVGLFIVRSQLGWENAFNKILIIILLLIGIGVIYNLVRNFKYSYY